MTVPTRVDVSSEREGSIERADSTHLASFTQPASSVPLGIGVRYGICAPTGETNGGRVESLRRVPSAGTRATWWLRSERPRAGAHALRAGAHALRAGAHALRAGARRLESNAVDGSELRGRALQAGRNPRRGVVSRRASPRGAAAMMASYLVLTTVGAGPLRADVDAELQSAIDSAVVDGRRKLLPRLANIVARPAKDHPMGRIALPLAAVLKSGVPPRHPVVDAAFRKLESLPLKKTYDVACYLFALDARWRARGSRALGGSGRTVTARPVEGKTRNEIHRAVDWLVAARAEGRGHWSYEPLSPGSGRHDYSNSQFAVLGLQIGLEHGAPIPRQVFEEIADSFLRSQNRTGEHREVKLEFRKKEDRKGARGKNGSSGKSGSPGKNDASDKESGSKSRGRTVVKGAPDSSRTVVRLRVQAGGWEYVGGRRANAPYPSMTAAGSSSLIIARDALKKGVAVRRHNEIELAILRSYAWIADHFDEFLNGNRWPYYTLYSLEKVGDLAGLEAIDGHEWYEAGARVIVSRQRDDGGWGSYVDTSFALLFLTRATKMDASQPRIYTSAGREGGKRNEDTGDSVYISQIDGFVSATEFLSLLSEYRGADYLDMAQEIVKNFRADRKGDLVAPLLGVWKGQRDAVGRFALSALQEITGIRRGTQDEFERWAKGYAIARELASRNAIDETAVRATLQKLRDDTHRMRVLDLVHRRGAHELAGVFIEELGRTRDPTYRRRIHDLLSAWTRRPDKKGRTRGQVPEDDDKTGWADVHRDWAAWWSTHEGSYRASRRARSLVKSIERATATGFILADSQLEKEVQAQLDELVQLGETALPAIDSAMRAKEFSFLLIEARERITGRPIGLAERDES